MDVDLATLRARELAPFAAAVEAGIASVMTSHIVVPAVDPGLPATLSGPVLGLLRDDLGYDGVIVTDALDMAGASAGRGIPEAAVLSLAAGADLLCIGTDVAVSTVRATQAAIVAAVHDGRLPVERLRSAAARVAQLRRYDMSGAAGLAVPAQERAARAATTVDGELPDLSGAIIVERRDGGQHRHRRGAVGSGARCRHRSGGRRADRPGRSSCRCATRTGDPRSCWAARASWSSGAGPGRTTDRCPGSAPAATLVPEQPPSPSCCERPGGSGERRAECGPRHRGGRRPSVLVLDPDGAILAQVREPTEPGAAGIVRSVARVFEALQAVTGQPLEGTVGAGIPGVVDVEQGALKHAVNLGVEGDWVPLRSLLADRLGVPVVLENDLNAAAFGAASLGHATDLVYLSIGTGLAAGLVLDGRLRRGVHGAVGEIGHVPVDPLGVVCQCGQRGCLETIASGSALAAAWPSADVHPAAALFAAAESGDPAAMAVRDRFSAAVADAIRLLSLAVDPASIVLGGGVAQLGEPLRAAVAQALLEQAADSPFLASLDLAGRLSVVPSDYPVAAVGAALLGR